MVIRNNSLIIRTYIYYHIYSSILINIRENMDNVEYMENEVIMAFPILIHLD